MDEQELAYRGVQELSQRGEWTVEKEFRDLNLDPEPTSNDEERAMLQVHELVSSWTTSIM